MADVNPTGATPPAGSPPPNNTGAAAATSGGLAPNIAGALAYILIIGIIWLLIEPYKNDKFVRFHAFQSIFYCVAYIALAIVCSILSVILAMVHLGFLSLIFTLVYLAFLVLWFVLVFQAYSGKTFKLPIIGDFAAKQAGL